MAESKIELTDRLRREGRWDEADRFKLVIIKECRARGLSKAAASEHAWAELARTFPPLPAFESTAVASTLAAPGPISAAGLPVDGGGESPAPDVLGEDFDVDVDELLERTSGTPDLARDTMWVYQHLLDRRATPASAPGPGAWSLLLWARKYQNRFFEQLLPKAMAAQGADDESDMVKSERKSIAEIERILVQVVEAKAGRRPP